MAELHVYRIEDDEHFWFIAESGAEAKEMYENDPKIGGVKNKRLFRISREPDEEQCAVLRNEGGDPSMLASTRAEIDGFTDDDPEWLKGAVIQTYGEWVRERGKGFFASTV